jgi:hypothetical protein
MKIKTVKPVSSVIYNNPSMLDGQPIIVVAIIGSKNSKTGAGMIQTYILRADINPLEASKTGADASICGDCIHRGQATDNPLKKTAINRSCYVNIGKGPNAVYKAFKRGVYPTATPEDITRIGSGKTIRIGSYGDPAAVPGDIWDALLKNATGWTGYTHQHKTNDKTTYERMMYSADNIEDAKQAHFKGYRTFRVIPVKQWQDNGKTALLNNEILCPASQENDRGVTCKDCMLCTGATSKGKNIAIVAHGATGHNFKG